MTDHSTRALMFPTQDCQGDLAIVSTVLSRRFKHRRTSRSSPRFYVAWEGTDPAVRGSCAEQRDKPKAGVTL